MSLRRYALQVIVRQFFLASSAHPFREVSTGGRKQEDDQMGRFRRQSDFGNPGRRTLKMPRWMIVQGPERTASGSFSTNLRGCEPQSIRLFPPPHPPKLFEAFDSVFSRNLPRTFSIISTWSLRSTLSSPSPMRQTTPVAKAGVA